MSENKTQWIIFGIGLLLIGWLYYLVNINNTQPKTETTVNQTENTKSMNQEHATPKKPVWATDRSDEERYEPKTYKEVFKETPERKTTVERVTESERIAQIKEKTDALIEKADARIKEKNLRTDRTPPSPEKIEELQKKADTLETKVN